VNGDGRLDVAVANGGASTISLLLGTGGGALGPKSDLAVGNAPSAISLADVSGDGRPDIEVANDAATVSVFVATGGGAFGPRTDYSGPIQPVALAVGNVNGDALPDLAVADFNGNEVWILPAAGRAHSAPRHRTHWNTTERRRDRRRGRRRETRPRHRSTFDGIEVLLGDGAGAFGPPTGHDPDLYPVAVLATDVTGDGVIDLMSASAGNNRVGLLRALGGSVSPAGSRTLIDGSTQSYTITPTPGMSWRMCAWTEYPRDRSPRTRSRVFQRTTPSSHRSRLGTS
jgi:hypothetical protein